LISAYPISWAYAMKVTCWHSHASSAALSCLLSSKPFNDLSCYQNVYSDIDNPERQKRFKEIINFMRINQISAYRV